MKSLEYLVQKHAHHLVEEMLTQVMKLTLATY